MTGMSLPPRSKQIMLVSFLSSDSTVVLVVMLMMRSIKAWTTPWTSSKPHQVRQTVRNIHASASSPRHVHDGFGRGQHRTVCRQCYYLLPWISPGSGKKSPHGRRPSSANAKLGFAVFLAMSALLILRSKLQVSTNSGFLQLGNFCRQHNTCHSAKPQPKRVIQYVFDEQEGIYNIGNHTRYDNSDAHPRRFVPFLGNKENQKKLRKAHYVEGVDLVETDDCKLRYEWQKTSRPTCNNIHEFDMNTPWTPALDGAYSKNYRIIGYGYWRDVWIVNSDIEKVVFKSMRYTHDFTLRNFDRMRRDAAVMDRLTFSENIIDLYGFCGTSSLSEYGEGGDILTPLENEPTQIERLEIAVQASTALADLHNADNEGEPSIAHTDIAPGQFIKVGDRFKLNDFNRARFLAWSTSKQEPCKYHVANNGGKFRSPEEYQMKPQSELVDVYSLGNILFMLLQDEWPFGDVHAKEAREIVRTGGRPSIYADIWNSTEPVNLLMLEAMKHCHEQEPEDRWSARQVEQYLSRGLSEIMAALSSPQNKS